MAQIFWDIDKYVVNVSTHGWFTVCLGGKKIHQGRVEELGIIYDEGEDDIDRDLIKTFSPCKLLVGDCLKTKGGN
jgi:hypothetical protein